MTSATLLFLPFRLGVPGPSQQPDALAERAVEQHRQAVRQRQHDRHHHDGLQDKTQAGEPKFDAVPPTEETGHQASVCV